jgi:hypothetical protein
MYAIAFLSLAMLTNGYLFWAIPILTMFPEYICPPDIPNCDYRDRCLQPDRVHINWESTRSIHNLVEVFNLQCNFSLIIFNRC